MEDVRDCLAPLEQVTKYSSGEKYPTLSSTLPMLCAVKTKVQEKKMRTDDSKTFQRKLIARLDKRFDTDKVCCVVLRNFASFTSSV